MAYNEALADRIREKVCSILNVIKKKMMSGLTFMVNDKMSMGIIKDELMCRIDPDLHDESGENWVVATCNLSTNR